MSDARTTALTTAKGLVEPAIENTLLEGDPQARANLDRIVQPDVLDDWKLKAKPDDGRLEVEFEVDSNRNGQVWAVRITDNGVQVFSGNRRIANRAGTDALRAVATNNASGERCVGTLSI